MTAYWVPFQLSHRVGKCEDRKRISLLKGFKPVAPVSGTMRFTPWNRALPLYQ